MVYLDCAQYDCCHNKAGACCLGSIKVHHAGEKDAVCSSYRCNESVGNVATDNAPATVETEVRCDGLQVSGRPLLLRRSCVH